MKVQVPFVTSNEDQVEVIDIFIKNGERVKKNQALFEIETTKTSLEIPADENGYIYFNFKKKDLLKCGSFFYEISDKKNKINKPNYSVLDTDKVITDEAKKLINKYEIPIKKIKETTITKDIVLKYINNKPKKKNIIEGNQNSVLIVGSSFHGATAFDFLEESQIHKPIAFINYGDHFDQDKFMDLNVYSINDLSEIFKKGTKKIYINTNDIKLTKDIAFKAEKIGYQLINIIHPSAVISKTSNFGKCVFIGPNSIIGTNTKIGSFSKLLNKASLAHDSVLGENVQVSDGAVIAGNVIIGNNCLIGINSGVINNCKIEDNVTVISGKIVTKNLKNNTIYNE
tara:strand:+ start:1049 stop:2071 length:1023 start_codon:yes stop_codon:yes gene_type:complete